jgi:hypothetical protein
MIYAIRPSPDNSLGRGTKMSLAARNSIRPARRPLKYWSGSRVEAEGMDGKERVRRIPFRGLQQTSDAARRPFCFAPEGLRRFWRWPALLAWPRSLRISALRSRLGHRQKSTATRPIPVLQRSPMGAQGQAGRIAQSRYFAATNCRLSRSTGFPRADDRLLLKLP